MKENNKEGNITLIVLACVLSVIVICLVIVAIYLCMSDSNNNNNKVTSNNKENVQSVDKTTNNSNTKVEKEDIEVEEVKKLDEAQGNIYEKEISINGSYNLKIPVINLTTKYATKVNSEVEEKYKDREGGKYVIYSYYMYIGMVSLILDNVKGNIHTYDMYNISLDTGKKIKNEELLEKIKISKEDFIKKVKENCLVKIEELSKKYNVASDENKKTEALNKTLKNAEDVLNNNMYLDHTGTIGVALKVYIPNVEAPEEVIIEIKK